ncbi:MAG: Bifunctional phosphoglucose/phosphomannose isomerase [Parcubacteria group bacterium GW2011_GWE2_39_37]|nr:MAG: Bifunctional phosphoglucose/phosphomannose isomerase [Parcubacteria group bacterium GW2011_GWE2_39_37]
MLDNIARIKKFDTGRVAESIEMLPLQMKQVLDEARLIKIPASYSKIDHVVINGMGGSGLGTHIIKAAFADQINVPISLTPGYEVPANVNKNTLYVLSSYSGTTEEVLSVYQEVKKRKAKIIAIVSKGNSKLEKLMIKDNIPGYIFKPQFNPSNQPRLGLGYSIFGMLVLFAKTGLFKINVPDFEKIITNLELRGKELRTQEETKINHAKKIAQRLFGKLPILVAGEFLIGNLHAFRNQICENSKNFATYLILPDLNHFAMEGLANPASNKKDLTFLFFKSAFYQDRLKKRVELTDQVVKKNKIETVMHELKGETKVEQVFELLQLGTWISFYLGILNQVDPVQIKWVDWFKKKLDE